MNNEQHHGAHWGKVIKGAAIAAGAVAAAAFGADFIGETVIGGFDAGAVDAAEAAQVSADKVAGAQDALQTAADTSKDLAKDVASLPSEAEGFKGLSADATKALEETSKGYEGAAKAMDPLVEGAQDKANDLAKIAEEKSTGWVGNALHAAYANPGTATAVGAGIGGLVAASAAKKASGEDQSAMQEQSFLDREQARQAQALMVARMQAQGYQPAMAMNMQQGRG